MARGLISDGLIKESEWGDGNLQARPFLQPFLHTLEEFPKKHLLQRRDLIGELGAELGMHFEGASAFSSETTRWRLDVLPRIIAPQEWEFLEAGLIQRARAFNALLSDLYGKQQILKDRIIPFEQVYDDPAFLYPCVNLLNKDQSYLTVGAVDLVRDKSGRWMVTGNHYSTPVGLSYILQNRRMLAQTVPELLESIKVEPVSTFSSDLIEALSSQSKKAKPRIVLLTAGGQEPVTFEEAFLARRMGIPIVEPSDLLVRDSRIVLKTVDGLEPIDIIYRRLPSIEMDPIAFGYHGRGGIPGLINCVRQGTVQVVNAIGCGVADNRSLLPYSDRIIQYYLSEIPLLPTVQTYICSDPDQRAEVIENADNLLLKPVHREHEAGGLYDTGDRKNYHQQMKKMLKTNPKWVVAQPFIDASHYPRLIGNHLVNRPAYLRAFTLLGDRPMALPGGLTRQAMEDDRDLHVADFAAGTKDTWVPIHPNRKSGNQRKHRQRKPNHSFSDFSVSSRVGENLYWMGRHSERAEHTVRMVNILLEFAWQKLEKRERQNLWPLWQAAQKASGSQTKRIKKNPPKEILPIARELILDEEHPGSALNNLRRAHWNAAEIREFITPEVWGRLNSFTNRWNDIPYKSRIAPTRLHPICADAIQQFALLSGTVNRTMLHDKGWECYRLGILLERAISTNTVLTIVLPHAITHSDLTSSEDTDLTTLLRMLGSLDAYQREYRSRTYVQLVAELLWKNQQAPNAIAYCMRNLIFNLESLHRGQKTKSSPPLDLARELKSKCQQLNPDDLFPNRTLDADQLEAVSPEQLQVYSQYVESLALEIGQTLEDLHLSIEDQYFSHLNERGR
ncbi:MAG: circularly permuted type 2 ATP-grasp protein [Verrucomicrobiota bacterium]